MAGGCEESFVADARFKFNGGSSLGVLVVGELGSVPTAVALTI